MRYENEWFYAKNVADSTPTFTGREPVSTKKWHYDPEARFKSKVLLKAVATLKQQGSPVLGRCTPSCSDESSP
jgi:hypothetical protein